MDNQDSTPIVCSPLLGRPGATPPCGPDEHPSRSGSVWHYGNPLVEQSRAEDDAILVDRSHHGVVEVTGADAATFLNNLLSQKLDTVTPGWHGEALDLDMNGHIMHAVHVQRTDAGFLLDAPSDTVTSLRAYLERLVFWSDVHIEPINYALCSIVGPQRDIVLAAVDDASVITRRVETGVPRVDVLCPRDIYEGCVVEPALQAGATLAGLMAWEALRVRAGEPCAEIDLDDKAIPHEVATWINRDALDESVGAVHLEKGCYRGQETVARVENLGSPPRALVKVQLDGSSPELPATGAPIMRAGDVGGRRPRPVGRVGTVVHDCDEGPIALALVKRSLCMANPLPADLVAGSCALAIDPDSVPRPDGPKRGREAIARLSGKK